jgi:uncharacterized phiE125 gp8 family phage protein
MLVSTVKLPEEFAVTLEEAKLHIRVVEDVEDSLIAMWIAAAHMQAERYLNRSLAPQTLLLSLTGFPCKRIYLPRGPVTAVVSVTYRDVDGALQTVASTDYRVINSDHVTIVQPNTGVAWPKTQADIPDATTITYKAGKAGELVPAPIKAAILLRVGDLHEHREAQMETMLRENEAVHCLLHPYRVYDEQYMRQECCVERSF